MPICVDKKTVKMLLGTICVLFLLRIGLLSAEELLVCETFNGVIQCDEKDTVIFVEDAFYGRRNVSICNDSTDELERVYCIAPKSLPVVWETCHGKTSCILTASNKEFGTNPCPQLSKYLSVQYRCDKRVRQCQHNNTTKLCPLQPEGPPRQSGDYMNRCRENNRVIIKDVNKHRQESDIIGQCPFEFWYPWVNADTPRGTGDYETFQRHRASLPEWCERPQAVQIQLNDGSPMWKQNDVIKTGFEYGVSCSNTHQSKTECGDYKARFCCPSDCKELITNKEEGIITSPNYPSKYQPNTDCSWIIKTDFDKYLTFTIIFLELENRRNCLFDVVKIIDLINGKEVFHECLLQNSTSLKVSGNEAQIRFISDEDNQNQGFSIEFKALKIPTCEKPDPPLNGIVKPSTQRLWRAGTVIKYFCDEDYDLEGVTTATCEADLKWSHQRPLCRANCASTAEDYYRPLPDFCRDEDGRRKYVNVGKCSKKSCQAKKKISSDKPQCCQSVQTITENINCSDFVLPVTKILKCDCSDCVEDKIEVTGIAYGKNEKEPLVNGSIEYMQKIISKTDENGNFLLSVATLKRKITLTFVDGSKNFFNKIQVVDISPDVQTLIEVQMTKRPIVVKIDSKSESTVILKSGGSIEKDSPMFGEVNIPPDSIRDEEGNLYEGEVDVYAHSVDNDNPDSWQEVPGPFVADIGEEDEELVALKNLGVFQFQANSPDNKPLIVENVEIRIGASHIEDDDLENVHIWSFNGARSLWEDDGPLEVFHDETAGEDSATFLIGKINVTVDRIWSLNVIVEEYCYAKVRTFGSPQFDHRDQLDGIVIRAVYLSSSGRWTGFSSEITADGNGACIMVPCNKDSEAVQVVHVTAPRTKIEELWAVTSKSDDLRNAGFSQHLADMTEYRRSDHDDESLSKTSFNITFGQKFDTSELWYGPIYDSSISERCFLAPPTDSHFRFYKPRINEKGKSLRSSDYTAVSDVADIRYWGPQDDVNRACFIKVAVIGVDRAQIRVTSIVENHPEFKGQSYGYRQKYTTGEENISSACIEFKCADYKDGVIERPKIKIRETEQKCELYEINSLLQNYLDTVKPTLQNEIGNKYFQMFSPTSSLGDDFGIYTSKMLSYEVAKAEASDQCSEGSSVKPFDGKIKYETGVAITFKCL